jgi:hypothetical protein
MRSQILTNKASSAFRLGYGTPKSDLLSIDEDNIEEHDCYWRRR